MTFTQSEKLKVYAAMQRKTQPKALLGTSNNINGSYSKRANMINSYWFNSRSLPGNTSCQNVISPDQRAFINTLARDLFRSSPIIGSAIQAKNMWGFSTGWDYTSNNLEYEEYIKLVFHSPCNMGYEWNRMLYILANAQDLGDILPLFYVGKDGMLKVRLVSGYSIGSRIENLFDTKVKEGRYKGADIYDGVIVDRNRTPIGYNVLGKTSGDDTQYSTLNGKLLYEAHEEIEYRGLSRLGKSIYNVMSQMEIEEYLIRSVRNESRISAAIYSTDGTSTNWEDSDGDIVVDGPNGEKVRQVPRIKDMGDFLFFNGRDGEKIELPSKNNPGNNTQEWLRSIEAKAVTTTGWFHAFIDPVKLDATAARTIEELVNKEIETRQKTIKAFAKEFVVRALANGMEQGHIPRDTTNEWLKFEFSLPEPFTIDSYYGAQIDNENVAIGLKSQGEVVSKRGGNIKKVNEQRLQEGKDKVDSAVDLMSYAKTKGVELSFERASDWLGTSRPQVSPKAEQTIETKQQ